MAWGSTGYGSDVRVLRTTGLATEKMAMRAPWRPCIGGPLKGGLAPNEAQGRGFAHSHGKGHDVGNLSVERMRTLLAGADEEVDAAVRAYQKGFLAEASTVQYDDALALGAQMPFPMQPPLPPVPFTQKQQMQSRMDGGKEEDGPSRALVTLAPGDAVGRVAREGESVTPCLVLHLHVRVDDWVALDRLARSRRRAKESRIEARQAAAYFSSRAAAVAASHP